MADVHHVLFRTELSSTQRQEEVEIMSGFQVRFSIFNKILLFIKMGQKLEITTLATKILIDALHFNSILLRRNFAVN